MKNKIDFIVIVDEETGRIIATDNPYEYTKWLVEDISESSLEVQERLKNETRRKTRNSVIIKVMAVAVTVGIFKKINDYKRSRGDNTLSFFL